MNSLTIAKRWLQLIGLAHILGGLALPWLLHSGLTHGYRQQVFTAIGANAEAQHAVTLMMSFIGPTIASWGVLFLYLVNTAFRHPNRQAWYYLVLALLAWAPLDAGMSWMAGIYSNIVLDIAVVVAISLPIFLVRRRLGEQAMHVKQLPFPEES